MIATRTAASNGGRFVFRICTSAPTKPLGIPPAAAFLLRIGRRAGRFGTLVRRQKAEKSARHSANLAAYGMRSPPAGARHSRILSAISFACLRVPFLPQALRLFGIISQFALDLCEIANILLAGGRVFAHCARVALLGGRLRRSFVVGLSFAALSFSSAGFAADMPTKAPLAPVPMWSWTGFYIGMHSGLAVGESKFSDPFGPSIFGDKVTTPGYLSGAQIGYNYQVNKWVYGVEADASFLISDGTNTCFAYSGNYVSSSCHSKPNALGTLTGRIGYAAGPAGHTLLYAKGGAALVHNDVEINVNNLYFGFIAQPPATTLKNTKLGWTVGAGVEQALTPAWSMKLE